MSNKLTLEENAGGGLISLFGLYKPVLPLHYQVYYTVKALVKQVQWRKLYQSTSLNIKYN
jgi:hypothetical protein